MIVTAVVPNVKMQHIVFPVRLVTIFTKEVVLLHVVIPQLLSITHAKIVHLIALRVLAPLITAQAVLTLLFYPMVHVLVLVLVLTCLLIAHKLVNFVVVNVLNAVSRLIIALVVT